jgi:ubiquitin carboxyl-terminal hydrolase 5/13
MEWLFSHMDDPGEHRTTILLASHTSGQLDIDDPIQSAGTSQKSAYMPSEEQVVMLAEMGFTSAQARKALRETVRSRFVDCHYNRLNAGSFFGRLETLSVPSNGSSVTQMTPEMTLHLRLLQLQLQNLTLALQRIYRRRTV